MAAGWPEPDGMEQKESFCILGAGVMGRGLAKNLHNAGAVVQVYARNLTSVQDLTDEGIGASSDPLEAARTSSAIVLCLTTDEVVRQVFLDSGVLDNLGSRSRVGEKITVIDTGTTSPELTAQLALLCKEAGLAFLDAPMTGSKNAAAAGEILFMVGGPDPVIDSQKFFFDACGRSVIRCGPTGSGQKVKIALNLTQASMLQALTEGLMLSRKLGVEPAVYEDVIRNSAARCGLSDFKLGCILRGDFEEHFALKNMNKDVNHAMRLARDHNVSLPLAFSLKSIYEAGMNMGYSEDDFCGLARVNETLNGL